MNPISTTEINEWWDDLDNEFGGGEAAERWRQRARRLMFERQGRLMGEERG